MTLLYKLTDENDRTRGDTQWGEGIEVVTSGEGELCGPGFTPAYAHPLLAVLLNPVHADFKNPRLWLSDGDVAKNEHGLKVGCTRLKTIRRLELPTVTLIQRVAFGVLAAREVCLVPHWLAWADGWLSGRNRSGSAAANAAANAAYAATRAANAANAATRAANAAYAATRAGKSLDLVALARQAVKVAP
jgi:hypothetical protein